MAGSLPFGADTLIIPFTVTTAPPRPGGGLAMARLGGRLVPPTPRLLVPVAGIETEMEREELEGDPEEAGQRRMEREALQPRDPLLPRAMEQPGINELPLPTVRPPQLGSAPGGTTPAGSTPRPATAPGAGVSPPAARQATSGTTGADASGPPRTRTPGTVEPVGGEGPDLDPESNNKLLRQRMLDAGQIARGDGNEAHHIVLKGGGGMTGDRDPERAQEALRRFGIPLESLDNGVALPKGFHRGVHTAEYIGDLNKRLGDATSREEALDILHELKTRLLERSRSGGRR